jgi:hypothetical protein
LKNTFSSDAFDLVSFPNILPTQNTIQETPGLCTPEANPSSIVFEETQVHIIIGFVRRLSQRVGGVFKSLPASLFLLKPWNVHGTFLKGFFSRAN